MSQTKIKNKTPIKLKLAFISKKSIPSEQFQSEDRPAELIVKKAVIALFFNFRKKLKAPKKKPTTTPPHTLKHTAPKSTNQPSKPEQ